MMLRFLPILLVLLLFCPSSLLAASKPSGNQAVQTTYKVLQGDTLSGIAQKSSLSVAELKRLNNLSGDKLKLGQVLTVSKASAGAKAAKATASSGKASATTASATHKVKQGDTLSAIAQKARISVAELKRLNKLSSDNLKLGQLLVLSKKATAPLEKPATAKMQTLTHKVKKGDTLYEIAQRTKTSVAELKRLNNLSGDRLKLGQVLVVGAKPVTVTNAVVAKTPSTEKDAIIRELTRDIPVDANASIFEKTALSFLNTPYRFGGNGKGGIDCSGFVQKVFREFDLKLPRTAREQYSLGTRVPKGDLQLGDLIFFQTYAKYPSHVGIYLGDNKMIHASSRNQGVVVSSINSKYFRKRFIGAKRLGLSLSPEEIDLVEFSGRVQATVADEVEDGTEEGAQIGAGNG
jgi:LysM repeat protein